MSIIQSTAKGGSTSFYDFPIGDSLRFDGSSYLSRIPTTAGNRKTWTWSGWVKRGAGSNNDWIFGTSAGVPLSGFYFDPTTDTLKYRTYEGGASENVQLHTNAKFRDPSAWYHIVVAYDTTQTTSSNRIKFYVNGEQITSFSTATYPTPNYEGGVNNTTTQQLGAYSTGATNILNGYLANIQFIDGQALDPYFFGETKDNIWVPYNAFSTAGSGTATASDSDTATDSYGTNGFHLTFEDGIESLPVGGYTGNQNAFRDKSHNTNHWKTN